MFYLAPRFPSRLAIGCQDVGLEKKAVLHVLHAPAF